jgi:hypothetical protein
MWGADYFWLVDNPGRKRTREGFDRRYGAQGRIQWDKDDCADLGIIKVIFSVLA